MKRLKLPKIYDSYPDLVIVVMDGIDASKLIERFANDYPDCTLHFTDDLYEEQWQETPHLIVNISGEIPPNLEQVLYSFSVIKARDIDGLTQEQKLLISSDWKAIRIMERVMYALYQDHKISLSDDAVVFFEHRERLREQVDESIVFDPDSTEYN